MMMAVRNSLILLRILVSGDVISVSGASNTFLAPNATRSSSSSSSSLSNSSRFSGTPRLPNPLQQDRFSGDIPSKPYQTKILGCLCQWRTHGTRLNSSSDERINQVLEA